MGKHLGPVQSNHLGFHPSHGKTGHGPVVFIGKGIEIGIYVRDQLIHQNSLERLDIKISESAAELDLVCHAVCHHNDERFDLAVCDQIVHDQVGVSLGRPGGFIFTPSVLQVQHRIFFVFLFFVARRRIDKSPAYRVRTWGIEKHLLYFSVGNVLHSIEILIVGRDFYSAFPSCGTIEIKCSRIVEDSSVHGKMIIMEPLIQRSGSRSHPGAVFCLLEHGTSPATQAEADANRLCVGSFHTESCISLGIDLGILSSGLVKG